MATFVTLFGDKLQGADGQVDTATALAGKKAVGIYFSAHWCPPCRGFTPMLAEFYKKDLQKAGMEIIFVSSDKDQESFDGYFKEQPWLALPFADRERKSTLSKKFKVQGIPTFIILDGDGNVTCKDGRSKVMSDPTGSSLPWAPKPWADVIGDTFIKADGSKVGKDAISGKTLLIYFSAHWCPPCRGFTPKFAEWYTKDLQKKGLEVVFVSGDQDEKQFKEYYSEQPWLSLPFDDKETNAKLNKKYKVQGIPSVVILGPTGELITKDGRAAVSQDPTGEEMPWKPKTLEEIFSDAKLVGAGGIEKQGKDLKGTVFGLYFSAHWCPPCRGFTPQLAEWYQASLKAKGFEIVFVSSDKDEGQFKEYFAEQPWLALDFTDRKRKEQLSKAMNVEGIPSFVIVDKDGSVITKDGRAAVTEDPTGGEFPWYPKPVSNLKSGPDSINETPTVVAFCETADAATKTAIEKSMEPIAGKYLAEAKAAGEETPEVGFMIVTEKDGMAERVRTMLNLQKCGDKPSPSKLMLVDIPDDGGYYEGPEGEITEPIVRKLVDDYLAKKLERKQLE